MHGPLVCTVHHHFADVNSVWEEKPTLRLKKKKKKKRKPNTHIYIYMDFANVCPKGTQ